MKETVMDVLMYLFERYLDEETEVDSDRESLRDELAMAGFGDPEISKAFDWLEGLAAEADSGQVADGDRSASRVYVAGEVEKLDTRCRGLLVFLEQAGVLNPITRELVVDRAMALETDEIDLDQLKWVVLMVLFNQPGKEEVFAWMEDLVFDESTGLLH